ncbi:bifunctional [glutamine synthetase] adenylyltransferase/[glutamine synthetase]-adenylyl-L-tyrosine phosphorylase [Maritimibacter alkaliphilus]|uniref:bifunctional [glutamine synthetase] adenylyltransferase/[glutamine synthetase]-adenylyl-L-tyrosine phosphorylase n=1 Tax=Maritimibacter alkaliphilus TaxID=404236 RepID=UPI001C95F257|nr:bifunctional [glutamine synthetase] adenylyltransferase/[glutamine synthetase]-adenylyl-L-tyrosine phosphorylase [Maritimibacter alkaliphilus]MBY6090039.1 bifunctional [glutamine synthetase] adenylyltransferase/[glutamine synthetase]-adenylyl-L-tyrosine phosphorylase [Maritimibacter alkaliphilus]
MTFAARMTRCPRPFDPERGAEARALLPDLAPELLELIEGTGGCSPYLLGLMHREADWLRAAFDDPEAALDGLHADLPGQDNVESALRQGKRRVALLTALADLGGVWALEEVTGRLSGFADLATDVALKAALAREVKRGKLPGMDEAALEDGAGMVVLAMGKGGARELNYSSDIDLIVLYDEARFDADAFLEARPAYIRATRRMAATLSEITAEGYVFRTDLRLRPDPSVTPVCVGMEAAERYYESLGRTWERAAYIKARPCAGDLAAGQRFLDDLRPFVWRRHLDFAAIRDAHDMRRAIRDHKGLHGPITLDGHNMKLGRGGIREVEFFTQFHQIIAGGRDPELRIRGTVPALAALADKGWVPGEVAEALTGHYRAHREVEHRLQMVNDAQTHALPSGGEGLTRIAALMGREEADLAQDIRARLTEVHEIVEHFFAREENGGGRAAPAEPCEMPDYDAEVIARWRGYPALRSSRAQEIFERLKPEILTRLARAAHPHEALLALDGFLAGLPAGVQVFSLFEANPQLIDLLGDIVGTAPDLARYLSRNASVFDAVIGGRFFAPWPGLEALCKELTAVLQNEDDYETRLDAARRWLKEWHFRVGVHHLRGLIEAEEAGMHYADIAEAVLRGLWPVVVADFSRRHGPPPGRGAVVVGMGSLGAGRLNARSDLDLIVIYDAAGVETSEGKRPLAARTYYARLTQALVTGLSAQMAEGRLYEVDMRLRPSGNQGPVATSLTAFTEYQRGEAWVWEHMALTRARVMCGDAGLAEEVTALRAEVLGQGRPAEEVMPALSEMRERIARAKAPAGPWDVKVGPGHNQDIELTVQAAALMGREISGSFEAGLAAAERIGWLPAEAGADLRAAYRLCWRVGQVAKLLSDKPLDPEAIGEGGRAFLLRETGAEDIAGLETQLEATCAAAAARIGAALALDPAALETEVDGTQMGGAETGGTEMGRTQAGPAETDGTEA